MNIKKLERLFIGIVIALVALSIFGCAGSKKTKTSESKTEQAALTDSAAVAVSNNTTSYRNATTVTGRRHKVTVTKPVFKLNTALSNTDTGNVLANLFSRLISAENIEIENTETDSAGQTETKAATYDSTATKLVNAETKKTSEKQTETKQKKGGWPWWIWLVIVGLLVIAWKNKGWIIDKILK